MRSFVNRKASEGVDFSKSTSKTQQEFKDSCDINEMIRRALIGDASVLRSPQYADVRNLPSDSHELANIVANANTAWHDMPDSVRATFGSVDAFIDYLSRPQSEVKSETQSDAKPVANSKVESKPKIDSSSTESPALNT